MKSWGGKRHLAKPMQDAGLVLKALQEHEKLVCDLGPYEAVRTSSGVEAAGLYQNLELILALVKVEKTCEIHSQPLRAALQQLLVADPSLNKTKWNGQVWIGLRVERITTLLTHFRTLCRDSKIYQQAALKLKSMEMVSLKGVMDLVELRIAPIDPAPKGPYEPPSSLQKAALQKEAARAESSRPEKVLKKNVSEVSVDSSGFPRMLKDLGGDDIDEEPEAPTVDYEDVKPEKSSNCKWSQGDQKPELMNALGFNKATASPPLKKGALKKAAAKPKSSPSSSSSRTLWLKLYKTVTKKEPFRAYICGTTEQDPQKRLIVEVTQKQSPDYLAIIDKIMDNLDKKSISKDEALAMKQQLCNP